MPARGMLVIVVLLLGQLLAGAAGSAASVSRTILVNGVKRTALVYPGKHAFTTPSPLVLVFHGFTGTARSMARLSGIHDKWPEATVVYPQGLPTYSRRLRKMVPAWQPTTGRDNDRDVYFIDALLQDLCAAYKIDKTRIYATGSSNGAMFSYVLFIMRPQYFAAFGIVAGSSENIQDAAVPRPMLIIHGTKDESVKVELALKARNFIRCLNGCGENTQPWNKDDKEYLSYQPCATGQPLIWHLHHGGHIWPDDASDHLIRFFKEHSLPAVQ